MSCIKIAIMTPYHPPPTITKTKSRASSISTASLSSSLNMSYRGGPPGGYGHWSLTPVTPVASPPSASPFSPMQHQHGPRGRNVSEIIPRLYISDLSFAENPAMLASYRITHILSTLPDNVYKPPPSLLPLQPARMQIQVEDTPFAELAAHLPNTTQFIRGALEHPEARVLVHCVEGISRSTSVVAAFLVATYGWSVEEAVAYVKSKRIVADPNFGFVQQLGEFREGLVRAGVVPRR